ncbi:ABC transporter G family member 36-like [Iris pallida]|uniref:ABC transporter G family member 36-like n=1 Tax=Iris pallida TaxID=29817 RepID=A0AAX6IEC8_IRIPA|nr:ABC transporter G family member 36-like [Iris pallida]KAJ6851273.1 ABC transporter G family member 36-like [Iris pallida]
MGMDALGHDTTFTNHIVNTEGLQLGADGGIGSSRDYPILWTTLELYFSRPDNRPTNLVVINNERRRHTYVGPLRNRSSHLIKYFRKLTVSAR